MTIRELITLLDGNGLIVDDEELMIEPLAECGLSLDSEVISNG